VPRAACPSGTRSCAHEGRNKVAGPVAKKHSSAAWARNRRHFFLPLPSGTNETPRRVSRLSRFAASFSANCDLPFSLDSLICPACLSAYFSLSRSLLRLPIAGPLSSFRTSSVTGRRRVLPSGCSSRCGVADKNDGE